MSSNTARNNYLEHFAIQRSFVRMKLDQCYAALADPSRRAMLGRLAKHGTLTVSSLAEPLAIGMPTVLKHLDVLTKARLIKRRKVGRVVSVTFVPSSMRDAMAWLERTQAFWTERLDRLAAMIEEDETR